MNYISVSLYRKMLTYALEEGVSASTLDQLPVTLAETEAIQAVPADVFFELHETLDQLLGPGFSVRVGQQMKIDDYGVLGLSWRTCSQAKEIFERSERYFKLLSNTYVFQVVPKADTSDVLLFRDAYRRGVALSNEATFSATVVVLQAMTETDITPVQVAFKHQAPTDLSSYKAAFQCPILFNQAENALTYRSVDLATRTAKADRSINQFLVERVQEATDGIKISASKVIADVEMIIQDALPSGIPTITQVSRHLGMSSRTLTRRLAENRATFRDLIRGVQLNVAKNRLSNPDNSIGDVAFYSGFSEQSAFSRAFKRWTGQTPLEFRKQG